MTKAPKPQKETDSELQDIDELQELERHPSTRAQGRSSVLLIGLAVAIVVALLVVWFATR